MDSDPYHGAAKDNPKATRGELVATPSDNSLPLFKAARQNVADNLHNGESHGLKADMSIKSSTAEVKSQKIFP